MRFILILSSEDLQGVYMKNIHAELISFMFLLISEVRNIVKFGKLRTFWKSIKYQRAYFTSYNFTQEPSFGDHKDQFLKVCTALSMEVNSKQGSKSWENRK